MVLQALFKMMNTWSGNLLFRELHKALKLVFVLAFLGISSGCATQNKSSEISLPVFPAWYEGKTVYYITTDVSDPDMAVMMNANYVPRLRDAVPPYPKPPTQKTVLERVYAFPKGEQKRSVFPSVPDPIGPKSQDAQYSPLWLMVTVEWKDPSQARELKSEGEIFEAEAREEVVVTRTNIVVNCPVVPAPDSRTSETDSSQW